MAYHEVAETKPGRNMMPPQTFTAVPDLSPVLMCY